MDDWVYILIGVLIGIPVGMAFFKYVIEQEGTSSKVYGAQYAYDERGMLTQYMPVPAAQG